MGSRLEGTRLALARRWLAMSRTTLADRLDVSVGAVTQWEAGERDGTARVGAISKVVEQSPEFLCGDEVPVTDAGKISFRKRHDASRAVRDKASAKVDYAAGVLNPAVRNVFGRMPVVNMPSFQGMRPSAAADALRREWGLTDDPLRNVVEQMEAKGVRVFWVDEPSPSLSAFCKWIDGEPFVLLNTAKRDGCRSRFDACHELGHLVLHRDLDFDSADMKEIESEANDFASAFLMPRDTFLEDAPRHFSKDAFLKIKKTWGVSVQAMVKRLHDLKVFTDWQYESAFRQMSSWGWRSNPEPYAGLMEMSKVHWLMCERLDGEDVSPEQFARTLGAQWKHVSELMPVLRIRQMNLAMTSLVNGPDPFSGSNNSLPYDD